MLPILLHLYQISSEYFCIWTWHMTMSKNDAILRDVLNFRRWKHQKWSNSARLPSKMESWVRSWRPRTNASCDLSIGLPQSHNGVHFFIISTSTSAPTLKCLVHFDFDMCFAPQPRALFRQLNFQKCSGVVFFVRFYFEMCFAPQRRALFRHLNFQMRSDIEVFCTFFTSTCASRHNGVQFFISHLPRWVRTRSFSEPTFRPSSATNSLVKHSVLRLFYLFARLHLLSSDSFSSLIFFFSSLFFSTLRTSAFSFFPYCHCRKFDF